MDRFSPAAAPLVYELELSPHDQTLRGVLWLPPGSHRLETAGWVPGAYAFLRYGRDLVQLRAHAGGRELSVERDGYVGYRIEAAAEPIELRFTAHLCDPQWTELAGLITSEHAVVHATRVPRLSAHHGPIEVQWRLPEGWAMHHPDGAEPLAAQRFRYPDFATLLDTPVVCGRFEQRTRTLGPATFDHVFLDRAVGMDTELDGLIDEVQQLAELAREALGPLPFSRYSFVWGFDPRAEWGLEHKHSTLIGVGPMALIEPQARFAAQRVAVHELVHAWNVCRMKPRGLVHADPQHGGFCDELWMAEGVTRYYEFLLCTRAGLCSVERFFSNLVRYARAHAQRPASAFTSLEDSSRATFLNHSRYPNAVNSTIDYYDAGMIAAFDLDAALRSSAQPSSLDAFMRACYTRFAAAPDGYTNAQLLALLAESQPQAAQQLQREIERPASFSLEAQLRALGFALEHRERPLLGVLLKGAEVQHVLAGSGAASAGLHPGDELIACDGVAWQAGALEWLLAHRDRVRLTLKRGAALREVDAVVGAVRELSALRFVGDAAQRQRLTEWLGEGVQAIADGQPMSLGHYDNFHGTVHAI